MHDETQTATKQGIFGHEVLNLLTEFGGATTVETLRSAAAKAFGPDAVFCNCHGDTFNFDELMAFFSSRGKVETDGRSVCLRFSEPCSGH